MKVKHTLAWQVKHLRKDSMDTMVILITNQELAQNFLNISGNWRTTIFHSAQNGAYWQRLTHTILSQRSAGFVWKKFSTFYLNLRQHHSIVGVKSLVGASIENNWPWHNPKEPKNFSNWYYSCSITVKILFYCYL